MDSTLVLLLAKVAGAYEDALDHFDVNSPAWVLIHNAWHEAERLIKFEVTGVWPQEPPE